MLCEIFKGDKHYDASKIQPLYDPKGQTGLGTSPEMSSMQIWSGDCTRGDNIPHASKPADQTTSLNSILLLAVSCLE